MTASCRFTRFVVLVGAITIYALSAFADNQAGILRKHIHDGDPLLEHTTTLSNGPSASPLPDVILRKLLTSVDQPVQYDRAVGSQKPGLGSIGALALIVGIIGALADKENANAWWSLAGIGLLVMLVFP